MQNDLNQQAHERFLKWVEKTDKEFQKFVKAASKEAQESLNQQAHERFLKWVEKTDKEFQKFTKTLRQK